MFVTLASFESFGVLGDGGPNDVGHIPTANWKCAFKFLGGCIMHQKRDFYKEECYNFLRWRHRPTGGRMGMPSLRCASAWQTDAFREIFASSER